MTDNEEWGWIMSMIMYDNVGVKHVHIDTVYIYLHIYIGTYDMLILNHLDICVCWFFRHVYTYTHVCYIYVAMTYFEMYTMMFIYIYACFNLRKYKMHTMHYIYVPALPAPTSPLWTHTYIYIMSVYVCLYVSNVGWFLCWLLQFIS